MLLRKGKWYQGFGYASSHFHLHLLNNSKCWHNLFLFADMLFLLQEHYFWLHDFLLRDICILLRPICFQWLVPCTIQCLLHIASCDCLGSAWPGCLTQTLSQGIPYVQYLSIFNFYRSFFFSSDPKTKYLENFASRIWWWYQNTLYFVTVSTIIPRRCAKCLI